MAKKTATTPIMRANFISAIILARPHHRHDHGIGNSRGFHFLLFSLLISPSPRPALSVRLAVLTFLLVASCLVFLVFIWPNLRRGMAFELRWNLLSRSTACQNYRVAF